MCAVIGVLGPWFLKQDMIWSFLVALLMEFLHEGYGEHLTGANILIPTRREELD